MRRCTRGAVFGAYLVINARHANAPLLSVIPLVTANAGPHVHHQDVEEFVWPLSRHLL